MYYGADSLKKFWYGYAAVEGLKLRGCAKSGLSMLKPAASRINNLGRLVSVFTVLYRLLFHSLLNEAALRIAA